MTNNKRAATEKPPTMTIPDVAAALQCSERHVFDLRKQKRIPEPTVVGKKKGVRCSV